MGAAKTASMCCMCVCSCLHAVHRERRVTIVRAPVYFATRSSCKTTSRYTPWLLHADVITVGPRPSLSTQPGGSANMHVGRRSYPAHSVRHLLISHLSFHVSSVVCEARRSAQKQRVCCYVGWLHSSKRVYASSDCNEPRLQVVSSPHLHRESLL